MGSTGVHRESGITDREFFEKQFPTMLGQQGRILACASKPASGEWNRAFYAAVKNNDTASYAPGKTWALIVLMHTSRTRGEYWNFTYKELDETQGPGEDACPDRILDLLSPTDHKYAKAWRERCRARNARVSKAKKLKHGQIVQFANPLRFTGSYGEAQRFRFVKDGRKSRFIALSDDGAARFRCVISGWQEMTFEIETTA